MKPTKVGIIGCGNIFDVYSRMGRNFENLEVAACADILPERARAKAKEAGIPKAYAVEELLKDPEIEIIVNLTVQKAHFGVGMSVLRAGKHLYNEKPLSVERAEARKLLDEARDRKLRVGCAPDTFLGAGLQTCRKLIDEGWIGKPVGAAAFMTSRGPEDWHPDPEPYYQHGGGPMFDIGPYYLTALVNLLGPVRRVSGSTALSFPERRVGSHAKAGQVFPVTTPTHVTGLMDFEGGASGSILMSFEVWASELPRIEIYGSLGTLSVPDPNTFGGPVRIKRAWGKDWETLPLMFRNEENSRGLGVSDMASAIQAGRPHRASGELAYHVLDLMHSFHDAAAQGKRLDLQSTVERPRALPIGLREGEVD